MSDRGGFLVVQLERADIDLLLGLAFDPIVRRRILAARDRKRLDRAAGSTDCFLGLPTWDAVGLLGVLTEIARGEGSDREGHTNASSARAARLVAKFARVIDDEASGPTAQQSGSSSESPAAVARAAALHVR
ncbi:MAG: hypothetical protein QNJ84_15195 [Alphaproteobacteria bacterium]|nr:hypothetical protein [Alphaproteobacteria bacterium]